jgi:hypothetical protein
MAQGPKLAGRFSSDIKDALSIGRQPPQNAAGSYRHADRHSDVGDPKLVGPNQRRSSGANLDGKPNKGSERLYSHLGDAAPSPLRM